MIDSISPTVLPGFYIAASFQTASSFAIHATSHLALIPTICFLPPIKRTSKKRLRKDASTVLALRNQIIRMVRGARKWHDPLPSLRPDLVLYFHDLLIPHAPRHEERQAMTDRNWGFITLIACTL